MSLLSRVTAAVLRAVADELEPPKPAPTAAGTPARDPASTTAASIQVAGPRVARGQLRRATPVGFSRPGEPCH